MLLLLVGGRATSYGTPTLVCHEILSTKLSRLSNMSRTCETTLVERAWSAEASGTYG